MLKKENKEDLAQECNTYMKIKQFMSKRIKELEDELDLIRSKYISQVSINCELIDYFKQETPVPKATIIPNQAQNSESLSINLNDSSHTFSYVIEEIHPPDLFTELKSSNVELLKENIKLQTQLKTKNSKIKQLQTDKILILNELNELIQSLRTVDIDKLNKFYLKNAKNDNKLVTYLGIKYNILSAQSQVSLLIKPKEGETEIEKKMNICENTTKIFQHEFERNLNKNIIKNNILDVSDVE